MKATTMQGNGQRTGARSRVMRLFKTAVGIFTPFIFLGLLVKGAGAFTWTPRTSPFPTNDMGVTFAQGKFVAADGYFRSITSPDGVTWTAPTPAMTTCSSLDGGIAYGAGRFVAVGGCGQVFTSSDGVTWTAQTSGTTKALLHVAYGGGQFVVTGDGGTILTSPDGVTWTARISGTGHALGGVAYGNGLFVVGETFVSPSGYMPGSASLYTSSDGITWTKHNSGLVGNPGGDGGMYLGSGIMDIAYDGCRFIAVGENGAITHSADGVTWTPDVAGGMGWTLYGVAHGNGVIESIDKWLV